MWLNGWVNKYTKVSAENVLILKFQSGSIAFALAVIIMPRVLRANNEKRLSRPTRTLSIYTRMGK